MIPLLILLFAAIPLQNLSDVVNIPPPIELRIGILYHDLAHWRGKTRIEGGYDVNAEIIFGAGLFRPTVGLAINTNEGTSRAYGGMVLDVVSNRVFMSLSLGLAAHINSVRKLGSPILFRLAGEIGYKWGWGNSISILLEHMSNAWLVKENAGLDCIGIRYGYRWGE